MNRALTVTRMQLTDKLPIFAIPTAVLSAAMLITLGVFALVPADGRTSGSPTSIYVVVLISGVGLVSQSMHLALGLGASRKAFTLGSGLTGVVQALIFGTLLLVLNRLEVLTEGWGLGGNLFAWPWLAGHNLAASWLLFTAGFLAMFLLGGWASTIWIRWHNIGLLVGVVAAILVLGGLAVLTTWQGAWGEVGSWFAGLTPLTAAGWTALLCLVLAVAGHLTLRRAEL